MAQLRVRAPKALPVDPEERPVVEDIPPSPLRLSVVIVSFNQVDLTRRCLASIEASEARETFEVVVVDNGSHDGTGELETEFPEIKFMRLPKNFGLTKALNIGIRSATETTENLLLLHSDTELPPHAIRVMLETLDADPELGAVAPLLTDAAGHPTPQLNDFPPELTWQPATPGEVDYTSGAALLLRRFFVNAMRKIDERYGQYGSDAELCFKIRRGGKKIRVLSEVTAIHHQAGPKDSLVEADFNLGRAAVLGKQYGIFPGLQATLSQIFTALFTFRLGEFFKLLSGQKIDGNQG